MNLEYFVPRARCLGLSIEKKVARATSKKFRQVTSVKPDSIPNHTLPRNMPEQVCELYPVMLLARSARCATVPREMRYCASPSCDELTSSIKNDSNLHIAMCLRVLRDALVSQVKY